ncbi:hypothetical protein ACFV42_23240 [Streptomyces solisilvae]|uniref:hypothetical protein n=1 Tax=Streptomyces malaysiensis TaxID=92644 RepID=UPI0036C2FD8F
MAGERRASRAETVRGVALVEYCEADVPSWEPQPPCGPDPVTRIAVGIKDCLCNGLDACDRPVCWCCVVNEGEVATADWCACDCKTPCCKETEPKDLTGHLPHMEGLAPRPAEADDDPPAWQGMAWVRTASQQWVPQASGRANVVTAGGGMCAGGGLWRVTFNFGVLRCAKGTSKAGRPVPCEPREEDAFVALADAEIMRWVVGCCPALKGFPVQAAQWSPLPRQGACAGGVMAVTVDLRQPTDVTGCPVPERYC